MCIFYFCECSFSQEYPLIFLLARIQELLILSLFYLFKNVFFCLFMLVLLRMLSCWLLFLSTLKTVLHWLLLLLVSSLLLRYVAIPLQVICPFFQVAVRDSFSFRFFAVSLRCTWYGYIFIYPVWFSFQYLNLKSLIFPQF